MPAIKCYVRALIIYFTKKEKELKDEQCSHVPTADECRRVTGISKFILRTVSLISFTKNTIYVIYNCLIITVL